MAGRVTGGANNHPDGARPHDGGRQQPEYGVGGSVGGVIFKRVDEGVIERLVAYRTYAAASCMGPRAASALRMTAWGFLANFLDDVGLQFPAVGAAKEKSVAFESNWDAISRFPFPWGVTVGGSEVIFPGIDHAFQINHDRRARQVRSGFTQNFGFGLLPVFEVLTFQGAALPVQLLGAVSDGILQLKRRIFGFFRHKNCSPRWCSLFIILAIDTGTHEAGRTRGRSGCHFGK